MMPSPNPMVRPLENVVQAIDMGYILVGIRTEKILIQHPFADMTGYEKSRDYAGPPPTRRSAIAWIAAVILAPLVIVLLRYLVS